MSLILVHAHQNARRVASQPNCEDAPCESRAPSVLDSQRLSAPQNIAGWPAISPGNRIIQVKLRAGERRAKLVSLSCSPQTLTSWRFASLHAKLGNIDLLLQVYTKIRSK